MVRLDYPTTYYVPMNDKAISSFPDTKYGDLETFYTLFNIQSGGCRAIWIVNTVARIE